MDILVTGGSGFIGRNIIEHFSNKYSICAPSHAELEFLDEDAVRSYFKQHKFYAVIHCAVRPGHRNAKDPSNQLYNNLRMFFNLVRNADRFKKMIFLSSGLVYDMRYYLPKMKEEYFGSHIPVDEGGFSKYIAAKYIEKSENILELRLFGVFGKYEDYAIRFISNAICKTLFALPITIKQNRRFDYLYIEDLMPIIDYFIKKEPRHKAYNVTPDNSVELLTLAEKVRAVSNKDVPIQIVQEGMGVEYSGDNYRLKNEMGHLELTSIETAIEKLYQWYDKNRDMINKESLLVDK